MFNVWGSISSNFTYKKKAYFCKAFIFQRVHNGTQGNASILYCELANMVAHADNICIVGCVKGT